MLKSNMLYPAIQKEAKTAGATIYFGAEAVVPVDHLLTIMPHEPDQPVRSILSVGGQAAKK